MNMVTEQTTAEEESFKELFEASLKDGPVLKVGEVVKGIVVSIDKDAITLDVGTKAEAQINVAEFETMGTGLPAMGDELDAMVVASGSGVRLSVLEGRRQSLWKDVEAAAAEDKTISAKVLKEVKGGFRVALGGLEAFMPRSESGLAKGASAESLLGESCEVALIEVERQPENIVVSRKKPLEKVRQAEQAAFFEGKAVGDKVSGTVRRLTDFGAFVDLGGVDALLHVSDMSWRRINHPSEMLTVDQSVSAEIIKLNAETGKVSVSMRVLQEDPWSHAAETYEAGMRLTGTVSRLLDFGAVVELEAGVEGMIHRSEMSWTRKDVKPIQILTEGDVVDVAVLSVEPEERRIRLSLKEVSENPWQAWLATHSIGSKITGKVKNITDFGFFVGLDDKMDGLVHIGNLSWDQQGDEAIKAYQKGQDVECMVLGVDVDKQRISLGVKQLSQDPFETFLVGIKKGASVTGKVVEIKDGAAMVELADGVQARLALREVPRDHDALKVEDEVEAKILKVDKKRRQVDLSISRLLQDEERDAVRHYTHEVESEEAPSALALELQRKILGKD
ncbi:MAG: 30S ribosomal protein S1 [Mariprofundaceae bacterium]